MEVEGSRVSTIGAGLPVLLGLEKGDDGIRCMFSPTSLRGRWARTAKIIERTMLRALFHSRLNAKVDEKPFGGCVSPAELNAGKPAIRPSVVSLTFLYICSSVLVLAVIPACS